MFSGKQPTSETKYKSMGNDEQLQSVKELGMTFSYLNNKNVWKAFCATYEAIYEHLGDFDTWYATNRNGDIDVSLQSEWNKYVRAVLDSLVRRSRASFDMMEGYKKAVDSTHKPFWDKWQTNLLNRASIKIDGTCPNLD
ncbi:hypothetical protein EDB81DRAFT_813547 [Dactylonectria macrodidyma]|uniref:Uncharacterized protein n=1 Tax=Dactylonectria macrodidyma TaxID=307937 RepID=A0A9P9IKW8_9HYPO|nr:hypothetical protein EDB81DRAFT_813547 [Dactylonectria macrodidyma]